MSDIKTVAVLAKIRDCHLKECDLDCEHCELNFTNEEFYNAIHDAIDALLERGEQN